MIEQLKAKQAKEGLNDTEFAKRIGISQPMWSLMKVGKRQMGRKAILGVLKVYPEMAIFLSNPIVITSTTTLIKRKSLIKRILDKVRG